MAQQQNLADTIRIDLGSWADRAACRTCDPGIDFFPEENGDVRPARQVCAGCPVKAKCLEYALTAPPVGGMPVKGIWGGTSEGQRRRMKQGVTVAAVSRPTVPAVVWTRTARVGRPPKGSVDPVPDGMMRCSHCDTVKPHAEMTPAALRGEVRWCRLCRSAFYRDQRMKRRQRRAS